jgi:hypothetical protein
LIVITTNVKKFEQDALDKLSDITIDFSKTYNSIKKDKRLQEAPLSKYTSKDI